VRKTRENGNPMSTAAYATAADFQKIFTEDVNSLYLLSFLLTGNKAKAEECFVAGIGESAKDNYVFKEWAHSWARRTIIQNAIRLFAPRDRSVTAIRNPVDTVAMDKLPLVLHAEVRAILELAPLERFVFVMSVLERYSDHDCSIMLGCPRRDIATVRARAMQQLVALLGLKRGSPADTSPTNSTGPDAETIIELMIAQHFATPNGTEASPDDAPPRVAILDTNVFTSSASFARALVRKRWRARHSRGPTAQRQWVTMVLMNKRVPDGPCPPNHLWVGVSRT
jgi:DNA-directed RNA polymerase specialized sigma24 family protein